MNQVPITSLTFTFLLSFLLSGCYLPFQANPISMAYDLQQRRGACLIQEYQNQSQAWDDRTQTCYQLSPEQTAEMQRQGAIAWNKSIEEANQWAAMNPELDACIKRNMGNFSQSYSGQLMELCATGGTGPFWALH